jgi:amidophosphoribosyltransferase
MQNYVKEIYDQFSLKEIEKKVAELVIPTDISWNGSLEIIYQSVQGLRNALPNFQGDWYFTGDYPTPGGYHVLNTSYLNWIEGLDARSY